MTRFIMLMAVCLIAQSALALPKARSTTLYFMFFVRGDADRSKYTKEQLEKMQADHLANLGAQYKAGKALAAGPLDENLPIRGIVVLNVRDMNELRACFADDPFVQKGLLKIQAWKWRGQDGVIQKASEPFELDRYTLGVAVKGPGYQRLNWNRHEKSLAPLITAGDLALAGPISDADERLAIYIFRQTDQDKIRAALADDPDIKAGRVQLELYKLLMAKGILTPAK